MNSVNLIGRLTKDPETRMTGRGTTVADLRIAVNRPKQNGADQAPHYFTVVAYGKLADVCGEHLETGREIAVQGRLEHREWNTESGEKRATVEVVAATIDFLRPAAGRHAKADTPVEAEEEIAF